MNMYLDRSVTVSCLYNTGESKKLPSYVEKLKKEGFAIYGDGELFNPFTIRIDKDSFADDIAKISDLLGDMPLRIIPDNSHSPYRFSIYIDDVCKKEWEDDHALLEKLLEEARTQRLNS